MYLSQISLILQVERSLLQEAFATLARQMDHIFRQKLWYIMLEQFFMKYLWGLTGTYVRGMEWNAVQVVWNGDFGRNLVLN